MKDVRILDSEKEEVCTADKNNKTKDEVDKPATERVTVTIQDKASYLLPKVHACTLFFLFSLWFKRYAVSDAGSLHITDHACLLRFTFQQLPSNFAPTIGHLSFYKMFVLMSPDR